MTKPSKIRNIALVVWGIDLIAIAIAVFRAILLNRSPMRYFGENGYITWLSTLQLVVIAIVCWQIARLQTDKSDRNKIIKKPAMFWWLACGGMFFFALDETLQIHENLDKSIHRLLGIESTSVSGRLDDFVVLLYVGVGLLVVYSFRRELRKYRRVLPWFGCGLGFSLLTIMLDMLGHNRETFAPFADSLEELNYIHHWAGAIEEIPKIMAGGAFIITLFACKLIAKTKSDRSLPQQETRCDQHRKIKVH